MIRVVSAGLSYRRRRWRRIRSWCIRRAWDRRNRTRAAAGKHQRVAIRDFPGAGCGPPDLAQDRGSRKDKDRSTRTRAVDRYLTSRRRQPTTDTYPQPCRLFRRGHKSSRLRSDRSRCGWGSPPFRADSPIVFDPGIACRTILDPSTALQEASFVERVRQVATCCSAHVLEPHGIPGRNYWHFRKGETAGRRAGDDSVEPRHRRSVSNVSSDPRGASAVSRQLPSVRRTRKSTMACSSWTSSPTRCRFSCRIRVRHGTCYHGPFLRCRPAGGAETLQNADLYELSRTPPAFVGDLLADVSTFNHELAEC